MITGRTGTAAESGIGTEAEISHAKTNSGGLGLFLRSLVGLDREAAAAASESSRRCSHHNPNVHSIGVLAATNVDQSGDSELSRERRALRMTGFTKAGWVNGSSGILWTNALRARWYWLVLVPSSGELMSHPCQFLVAVTVGLRTWSDFVVK